MSNVLVYSGPGVSASALSHTLRTLRRLLPSYDVQCINAQSLALDPWSDSTALFVLPGGRDLPFVEKLGEPHAVQNLAASGAVTDVHRSTSSADQKIQRYVREQGGAFVGICAGAYYASTMCEFELGDPVMQVVGPRDALKFFPGTCSGTSYPGFVYESDQGARLVDVAMTDDRSAWTVYYNGGGAFMDADRYVGQGVEVLGRYVAESKASIAGTTSADRAIKAGYVDQAAIVLCQAGKGKAILYGVHPEFPVSAHATPTQASAAPETLPDAEMLAGLEILRLRRFGQHLQSLGLEVFLPALPTQQATLDESQPRLRPIVMTSRHGASGLASVLDRLRPSAASSIENLAKLEQSPEPGRLMSIADSNDTVHIYDASAGAALSRLCADADYSPYMASAVAPTADEARAAPGDSAEGEVDLQRVPKYVVLMDPVTSSEPALLPHWTIGQFYEALDRSRKALDGLSSESWAVYCSNDGFSQAHASLTRLADVHTYGHVVTSTQTMLDKNYRLLTRLPSGFTSFATHQVSGRGRGRNAWISPLGCLQFSTLLPVPSPQQTFWHAGMGAIVFVQYLAGLAIVESVRSGALGQQYADALGRKLRIKWPNDVYAEVPDVRDDGSGQQTAARKGTFVWRDRRYAKMAGVLVNSQFAGSYLALVVGCGINTLNSRPTTSLSDLIETYNADLADKSLSLPIVSQEQFAGAILATFERMWNVFVQSGGNFAPFVEAYRRAWLHSDQDTLLSDTVPPTKARIVGITSDYGLLRCVPLPDDGQTVHQVPDTYHPSAWGSSKAPGTWIDLQPDGNSFDMLQNLIRRKE